jgi:ATP-grasp domain-containing protein
LIPRVLLINTTWWPCASRLAASLTRAGCEVGVAYPRPGHPLRRTAGVTNRFVYSQLHPLASLRRAIRNFDPHLVVPCDDRAVQHLHHLHLSAAPETDLRALLERSLGHPSAYQVVRSREAFLRIAREEGLRVPEFAPLRTSCELQTWCAENPAPWVLKADGSWGGHGVKIVSDVRQAGQFLHQMSQPLSTTRMLKRLLVERDAFWVREWSGRTRSHVIAQGHIAGRPANCAVFAWEGQVLGLISLEVLQSNGVTGSATIVRLIDSPEMRLAAERIARRLHLSGYFGLDFMIEAGSGLAHLIEINPRTTPPCHLQLGEGRDLVEPLRSCLTGEPARLTPPVTENLSIAYFPQAWHWNPNSPLLRAGYHDVPWEDPGLIAELQRLPWPERGLLARLSQRVRRASAGQKGGGPLPENSIAGPPDAGVLA